MQPQGDMVGAIQVLGGRQWKLLPLRPAQTAHRANAPRGRAAIGEPCKRLSAAACAPCAPLAATRAAGRAEGATLGSGANSALT